MGNRWEANHKNLFQGQYITRSKKESFSEEK